MANGKFQILRGVDDMTSKLIAAAAPFGMAMEIDPSDRDYAIPAYGTGFEGFLTQEVTTAGVTALQIVTQIKDVPVTAGHAASLARGEGRIEVESLPSAGVANATELMITSGTGAITNVLAQHTELSFRNGKWRQAQVGDRVCGEIIDSGLTPLTASNIRCEIRVFSGGIKA
jgi:hypothetical protein